MTPEATAKSKTAEQIVDGYTPQGAYVNTTDEDPKNAGGQPPAPPAPLRSAPAGGSYVLIEVGDPDDTYCCHPSPKQLREWTREYRIREEGHVFTLGSADDRTGQFTHYRTVYTDAGERVELTLQTPRFATPCIDPLDRPDDDMDIHIDSGDPLAVEAYRRYTRLLARAEKIRTWANDRITHFVYMRQRMEQVGLSLSDEGVAYYEKRAATVRKNREAKLAGIRKSWERVYTQTHRSWAEISQLSTIEGREGQLALARDDYEMRYCHRDPSDFEILRAYVTDEERELLAECESVEDRDDLLYHLKATRRRSQVTEAWKRYWKIMGRSDDLEWRRIVKRWKRTNTGRFAPRSTQSFSQFVDEKVYRAGDELEGLERALASLRYRIVKQAAKVAA